jgi:hypothetical protein
VRSVSGDKKMIFRQTVVVLLTTTFTILCHASDVTFVDSNRGFSLAYPSDWHVSTNADSILFSIKDGPGVSVRTGPVSQENHHLNSIWDFPDADTQLIDGIRAIPNAVILGNGRTKLASRDAIWIRHKIIHEALGSKVHVYSYQVATLGDKNLYFCTYMASALTDQAAKKEFERHWNTASSIIKTLYIQPSLYSVAPVVNDNTSKNVVPKPGFYRAYDNKDNMSDVVRLYPDNFAMHTQYEGLFDPAKSGYFLQRSVTEYRSVGYAQISGNRIQMSLQSSYGSIHWSGTIAPDKLILDFLSGINGYMESNVVFTFLGVGSDELPPHLQRMLDELAPLR